MQYIMSDLGKLNLLLVKAIEELNNCIYCLFY